MKTKNDRLILKKFVKEFNFPDPDWSDLPYGFPNCKTDNLTIEEKHLFGAIKTGWIISYPGKYLSQKIVPITLTTFSSFITLTLMTMVLYYLNINWHLGLTFLTNFFA